MKRVYHLGKGNHERFSDVAAASAFLSLHSAVTEPTACYFLSAVTADEK